MNRIILTILIIITGTAASAQVRELEQFTNMKDVDYKLVTKDEINSTRQLPIPGFNELVSKLQSVQIVETEKKSKRKKLKSAVAKILKDDKFQPLVVTSEEYKSYIKETDDSCELVQVFNDEDEYMIIAITGNFTMSDIGDFIKNNLK